jgi:hypothetical protein
MRAWLLHWLRVFFPSVSLPQNPHLKRKAERRARYKELQRKAFEGGHK